MPVALEPLDRRAFLGCCAATIASLMPGQSAAANQDTNGGQCVALISDTHVHADPARMRVGQNVLSNFNRVLAEILASENTPDRVIINGDMAFLGGEEADYRTFLASVGKVRDAGLPVAMTLGNHDDRERFWKLVETNGAKAATVPNKHATVLPTPSVNWFLLDSLETVGATPGSLGVAQIEWLDKELSQRKDKPAFIMAHHNFNYHFDVKRHAKEVVPCADKRLPAPGMTDGKKLLDVFASHGHVSAFFCGHTHQWNVVDWNGIYLVNLPASAYPFRDSDAIGWVVCRTQPESTELELRSLDPRHKHHGQTVSIRHRV